MNLSPTSLLQAMTSGTSSPARSETAKQGMITLEQSIGGSHKMQQTLAYVRKIVICLPAE